MIRNTFTPAAARATGTTVGTNIGNVGAGILPPGRTSSSTTTITNRATTTLAARSVSVANYLALNGSSNPDFATGTSGDLRGMDGSRPRIQRGFIRRANNNNSSNPLSGTTLKFMYNPEQITRDYLSYLDTAAIDPFNTIFQSGNLVNAPSMVQFSFELFFDRATEAAFNKGKFSRGVMVDYDFFDMVVRNVSPKTSTSVEVPDNGVMMVNPEDIVVVFSKELTVQGRPINSRVQFTKFNNEMIPTRMSVSITMVINYFGPLRDPIVFTDSTLSKSYETLIPYDYAEQSSEETASDTASVVATINTYRQNQAAVDAAYAANTSSGAAKIWWGGPTSSPTSSGAAGMAAPLNGSLQVKALQYAISTFSPAINPQYDQGRRTQVPGYSDCISMVWTCFKAVGGQSVFGPSPWPTTASALTFWTSSNWTTMQKVATWEGKAGASVVLNNAQPGDLLFRRKNGKGHIAFVQEVNIATKTIRTFASRSGGSNPEVGTGTQSADGTATSFEYLLRPIVVGSQTDAGSKGKWF